MVNKNWTLEEAQAANQAALDADPSLSSADPALPFYQWFALHELDQLEKAYEKDKFYLMQAIRVCANHDLPLPSWAAMAFIEAYDKIVNAKSKSWDDVLGCPYLKGIHLGSIRKKRMLMPAVALEVCLIKKMNPEVAIDDSLFEEVGAKFGIGKTLASEYYYASELAYCKARKKQVIR